MCVCVCCSGGRIMWNWWNDRLRTRCHRVYKGEGKRQKMNHSQNYAHCLPVSFVTCFIKPCKSEIFRYLTITQSDSHVRVEFYKIYCRLKLSTISCPESACKSAQWWIYTKNGAPLKIDSTVFWPSISRIRIVSFTFI